MCAMRVCCHEEKRSNLKLKSWPKQDFRLPLVKYWGICLFTTHNESVMFIEQAPGLTIQIEKWLYVCHASTGKYRPQLRAFNTRRGCMCAVHLFCYKAKWPNLKLKTWPIRDFRLSLVKYWGICLFTTQYKPVMFIVQALVLVLTLEVAVCVPCTCAAMKQNGLT
jgi:hypothetical protein